MARRRGWIRRRRARQEQQWGAVLTGLGLGAGLMYMLDPDSGRLAWAEWRYADQVCTVPTEDFVDRTTDVVVTDHEREELGSTLESFLRLPARYIGVIGSARHAAPHIDALRRLGVPDQVIARIRRPLGLNIGSHTPAEIALSTLAGLIADRNRRPGGFTF